MPDLGGNKKPSLPGTGIGGNRPGTGIGGNRPGARPSPGDVGDFLGMDKPLKPGIGGGDRPGTGIGGNRPGVNRPNVGNNIGNRPINIGNINVGSGNTVISNRPTWANINNNRLTSINTSWRNSIGGLTNWPTRYPARMGYWRGWADGVRTGWRRWGNYGWFNNNWWLGHRHALCGWHYGYWFNRYPYRYWWGVSTFAVCRNWFTWNAPQQVWAEPVYYDYGTGGNVVYQDNSVYINNQEVATQEEFAQSAAVLATVEPPADDAAAEAAEWLPLGTFAISADEKDVDPDRVIQLAVNKQGVISGTLYNYQTDEAQSIQGQVDKETQRAAFRIGESEDIVAETGLYNLTQDEVPTLVHFGTEKAENYLLVRLEQPEEEGTESASE